MTDKEFIAYLVEMMSEQQYPCDICENGWRGEVCRLVDRTYPIDRTACKEGMRKWAEENDKEVK